MMVKFVPFSDPMHVPAMFWTFDRLQLFVWAAKIRNKCACEEGIETMPSQARIQPALEERVEREARRVRLWCERKDAMWDAMQAEDTESRATWKAMDWPWR
jgi:hypothetical protein